MMRTQMKNLIQIVLGIAFIGWVGTGLCFSQNKPQDSIIPAETARKAAISELKTSNLFDEWKDAVVASDRPIVFVDLYGRPSVYCFEILTNGKYDGYISISASIDFFPLRHASKGVFPPEYLNTCKQNAENKIGPLHEQYDLLYLGGTVYFVRFFSSSGANIILTLSSSPMVIPERNLERAQSSLNHKALEIRRQSRIEWERYLQSSTVFAESNSIEEVEAYTWYRGSVPTTMAMIFNYWGKKSEFPDLYHPPSPLGWDDRTHGTDDTAYIPIDLADHFADIYGLPERGGSGHEYGVLYPDENDAVLRVTQTHGYGAEYKEDHTASYEVFKEEIDNRRPVFIAYDAVELFGSTGIGHAACGIGYDFGSTHKIKMFDTLDRSQHILTGENETIHFWGLINLQSNPTALIALLIKGDPSLYEKEKKTYTATAIYRDGSRKPVTPIWSVDSSWAAIDSNGELTAFEVSKTQRVTITATYKEGEGEGAITKKATKTVYIYNVVLRNLTIKGDDRVYETKKAQYTAIGTFSDGARPVTPRWSVYPYQWIVKIDSDGWLTPIVEFYQDQRVEITATYTFGGVEMTVTKKVTIVNVRLSGLAISGDERVPEKQKANYKAIATFNDGSTETVTPSWEIDFWDKQLATIDRNGELTASEVSQDRRVTIKATYSVENPNGGKITQKATKSVTIVNFVLSGLAISGDERVSEKQKANYIATATFSDGTTKTVDANWSVKPSYATIDSSGELTASEVTADQSVTITARYTFEDEEGKKTTKTAYKNVTIVNVVLSWLEVSGDDWLYENTYKDYLAIAHFNDGTIKTVDANWSDDSDYATIDGNGRLRANEVTADQRVEITASYKEGEITKTDSKWVTIVNLAAALTGLTINGPSDLLEGQSATYTATATFSDGSTKTVNPGWSENSPYATINSSGVLTTSEVPSNQSVTITATYTFGGVTKKATKSATIHDWI